MHLRRFYERGFGNADRRRSMTRTLNGAYDAVVIGSGLGGSTLAYRLAQRGLKVLVLEEGDFLPEGARKSNAIGLHMDSFVPRPRLVGGDTNFYGAAMYRM